MAARSATYRPGSCRRTWASHSDSRRHRRRASSTRKAWERWRMARALYASRELERRIQDALITRISAVYERSIAREINTRMKAAAKAFEEEGNIGVDVAME